MSPTQDKWTAAAAMLLTPPLQPIDLGDGRKVCVTGWNPHCVWSADPYCGKVTVTIEGWIETADGKWISGNSEIF